MSKERCLFSETALTSIMVSEKENKTQFFNKIMSTPLKVQNGKQFIELLRKEFSIQEWLVTQPFLLSSSDIYKQLVFSHEVGVLASQHNQTFKSNSGTSSVGKKVVLFVFPVWCAKTAALLQNCLANTKGRA